MSRRLVLLGGAAGTGKSTAAPALAQRLDASWLQLDTLWIAMREAAPPGSSARSVLEIDAHLRAGVDPVEALVERHVAASAAVCAALPAALAFELDEHPVLVADGAWVLPRWAADLRLPDTDVRSVFLHEPDPARHHAAMRSRRSGPAQPWHETTNAVVSSYGSWLVGQATVVGLPVVEAQPYGTVIDRLLATLDPAEPASPSGGPGQSRP